MLGGGAAPGRGGRGGGRGVPAPAGRGRLRRRRWRRPATTTAAPSTSPAGSPAIAKPGSVLVDEAARGGGRRGLRLLLRRRAPPQGLRRPGQAVRVVARADLLAGESERLRPACGRRRAGCRRARPGGGARAAGCRPSAGRCSCGRRSCASPTATESGSALDSTVRRPQPQALASSSSPPTRRSSKPASRSRRRRSAGAKAWTSTSPSSAWPSDCSASATARRRAPNSAPPGGGDDHPGPLRAAREAVAVARGLAGEGDHAARPQHAAELGEGLLEVGDVVQDGVAEDEVEALVLEGQLLGLGGDRLDVEPERVGGRREPRQHPRRDVGRGQRLDRPELEQVEREVAGARADLQGVAEALRRRARRAP